MSHPYSSMTNQVYRQTERFPWLIALFLAAVFFLSYQDLYYSRNSEDAYTVANLVAQVQDGSTARRIAFVSLGFFAMVSLILHRKDRFQMKAPFAWAMLAFAAWALLSLLWADDLSLTFRRLVAFAILCLAAAAIARRFSLREIVLLTFFWSFVFLLVGICAEVFLGTFRPFTPGYRFAGTCNPNSQGINCALLFLSGFGAAHLHRHRAFFFRVCALFGLVFVILTGSRTAFVAAIIASAVYWSMTSVRAAKLAMLFGLGAASCLLICIPATRDAFMLGRGASDVDSFNGRTGLWGEMSEYIYQRPIAGYGFGGFWTEGHIADISKEVDWPLDSAHSAYAECLLDLGLTGLIAYVLTFLGGITRSFSLHGRTKSAVFAFSGAFLIFCVVDAALESIVIGPGLPLLLSMIILARLAFARETQPNVRFTT